MFTVPESTDFVNAGDQIELMERYILTLVSAEDTGVSMFAKDKNDPKAAHSYKWVWNVHKMDGTPILEPQNDTLWEFWEWTENRAGFKQDGSPSKARARLNALAGRELTDDEIRKVPLEKLVGRRMTSLFHRVKGKNKEGDDIMKLVILTVAPYKEPAAGKEPVAAAAPISPAPSPVSTNGGPSSAEKPFEF
jgi:hypothetical protein